MPEPPSPRASIAHPRPGGRLHAPSAARNAAPILAQLRRHAPAHGTALELAAGTGQHAAGFAAALPGLTWQPSEIDPARRASIDAIAGDAALPNLRPALALDASQPGWGARHAGQDLILLINLLHLIPAPAARTILTEAAAALAPAGRFLLYGPFLRDGQPTSDGDRRFHDSLRAQDPRIGYKDVAEVTGWGTAAGLSHVETAEMPANNLMIVWQNPG